MRTVEQALETILDRSGILPAERLSLLDARGRVLAEDIAADIDLPPFTNSAVDGYAVRAKDTVLAHPDRPALLQTVAVAPAGAVSSTVVATGTAVRIMTGAMIPDGADAVVMLEDTRERTEGRVAILQTVASGEHLRMAGEDVRCGDRVLKAGTTLRSAEIAMLASVGQLEVRTIRPARVAVVTTGDEVVEVESGVPPSPGKIRNSNRYALAALVAEAGASLLGVYHCADDPEATVAVLETCVRSGADVIVCAGGVSVGDRDFVKPALERLGTLELWRVAVKPGKPLAFGAIGETLCFGLPGNPVSAMVSFELFVRPALRKLAGHARPESERRQVRARLTAPISHLPGRREYVRAIVIQEGAAFVVTTTGAQGSGRVHSMVGANALIVVPEESGDLEIGEIVQVRLLD